LTFQGGSKVCVQGWCVENWEVPTIIKYALWCTSKKLDETLWHQNHCQKNSSWHTWSKLRWFVVWFERVWTNSSQVLALCKWFDLLCWRN
jgi:hypothetical protein